MKDSELQPYDSLRQIAPDLYILDGEWFKTRFRRRMTVIRMKSGQLMIHNPIRLKDEDYKTLDALGEVNWIVAPNRYHGSDAHYYKRRYPPAKLFVSQGATKALANETEIDGILPRAWEIDLRKEVGCVEFEGTRLLHENVFFHRASRTLIVTDLVFNMQTDVSGIEKAVFKFNRIYKTFGPSRVFRSFFVNRLNQTKTSFHRIMEWDFDRVIMNHGEILESGGKEALKNAFARMQLI